MRDAGSAELLAENGMLQAAARPRRPFLTDGAIRAAISGVLVALLLALGVDTLAGGDALAWLRERAISSNGWIATHEHPYGR